MSLPRAAMIALGLLAFAGTASSARAQSGMCNDALAESIESSVEAELTSASSPAEREGLEVVERAELVALAPRAPAQDERDLPWCSTPNDARCSKLPAGSTPGGVSVRDIPLLATHVRPSLPRATSTEHGFAPRADAGPCDAKRDALERPPR